MAKPFLDFRSGPIEIGEETCLEPNVQVLPDGGFVKIGQGCRIGAGSILYGHGGLTIGDRVTIGAHTVVIPANHVFADPARPIREQGLTKLGIKIGHRARIGSHACILDGVEVGEGALVAPGSVVTRSVPAGATVAGTPAVQLAERRDGPQRP